MKGKLGFDASVQRIGHFGSWIGLLLLAVPLLVHAEWGVNFQTSYTKSNLIQGSYPYALVTGDFTGDGIVDMAVANAGVDPFSGQKAQSYVSILGNRGGYFSVRNDIPTGFNTAGLAAGDFNKDGKLDLAAANFGSNTISILINSGEGILNNDQDRDLATGTNPAGIVCGDFNEDGNADLVVANWGSNSISVFLGKGNSSFNVKQDFLTARNPMKIAVGDFSRDGHLDLAVTCMADKKVSLFLGRGDGTFGAKNDITVDVDPIWIIATDLNGDGKPDLAVSCQQAVNIWLGVGDGTFKKFSNATAIADTRLQGLAAADLDSDGKLDLLVSHQGGGFAYMLPGFGNGAFSSARSRWTFSSDAQPMSLVAGLFNGDSKPDFAVTIPNQNQVAICLNSTTWASSTIPVVLSIAGSQNSFYTSEMTLTNPLQVPTDFHFTYKSSVGGGDGSGGIMLAPREQRIVPDAVEFLRMLNIPIPATGSRLGTVYAHFSIGNAPLVTPTDAKVTVRTTTKTPTGRAGLAYSDIPNWIPPPAGEVAFLCGLRQNARDRSNVAVLHPGVPTDPDVTIRLTVYSGDPANPLKQALPDITLKAGEFQQINSILTFNGLNVSQGFVKVERVGSAAAPFFAYGVINDQTTSDGSFILPNYFRSQFAISRFTLPVAVEAGGFRTEVIITNATTTQRSVTITYVTDAIQNPDHAATLSLQLQPAEQRLIPNFVQYLRDQGITGIGPTGGIFAGAVFAALPADDLASGQGFYLSARTSIAGDGGYYGLHYQAVPEGQTAKTAAWLYGLQQNDENRTNLALINTGENDDSTDVFNIEIYDGDGKSLVKTLEGISVNARQWQQFNSILSVVPDITQGYVKIVHTSGSNPFIAYAVINDGKAPNERSGDGAFIAMQGVE